ncbi:MAG: hypothetical protein Q7K57_27020 [Burkholderiaceae bacterium]|nr:hypothetical protein [Burkholderiaceae bacterium]
MTTDPDALKIANDSGFQLQIAIEQLVNATSNTNGWRVRYVEHAWANPAYDESGFIDIVLQDRHGSTFLVIECKRMRESTWLFMHSDGTVKARRHTKSWVSRYSNNNAKFFGWQNVPMDLATPEALFCAVRGQSANDKRTLIERIGSELISSTEALAIEERNFRRPDHDMIRFYFNIIVTTAELKVAKFDPKNISLLDGTLPDAEILDVPFLRFRKQMTTRGIPLTAKDYANDSTGAASAYAKEHTIFIVRADALLEFLELFEVPQDTINLFI